MIVHAKDAEDEKLRDELLLHLASLERDGRIEVWHKQKIDPGKNVPNVVKGAFQEADIFLLLVSAPFIASQECQNEVELAQHQSERTRALVIPVIIRPCVWSDLFGHVNPLPMNEIPITRWSNRDDAWTSVVDELRQMINRRSGQGQSSRFFIESCAKHLLAEVERLDWQENWAPESQAAWSRSLFTELEAEVEFEAPRRFGRFVPFAGNNLERARSLTKALDRATAPLVVLEGAPGTGKSVALRRVAYHQLQRTLKSPKGQPTIAIFNSLRGLERRVDQRIDANLIGEHVRRSLIAAGIDFPANAWQLEGIRWVLLLDAFDEIPEILSSTRADDTVIEYAFAISSFVDAGRDVRAVVATRPFHGLGRMRWPRYRLVSFGDARRAEFLKRHLVSPHLVEQATAWLHAAPQMAGNSGYNPLLLALLCAYISANKRAPGTVHDLFNDLITRRLEGIEGRIRDEYGTTPSAIRRLAEGVAYSIACSWYLGLEPSERQLTIALSEYDDCLSGMLPGGLKVLCQSRLGRMSDTRVEGDRYRFGFLHRRIQEFFASCVIMREPDRVPARTLLLDYRWREPCVALLQTQDIDKLEPILREAELLLAERFPTGIDLRKQSAVDFDIDDSIDVGAMHETIHVMSVLHDGLSGRIKEVPDRLRQAVGVILSRTEHGGLLERQAVLEVAGIADEAALLASLRRAFDGSSQWLMDSAYRQASSLREVPPDVSRGICRALVVLASTGALRKDWRSHRTYLARFGPPQKFRSVLNLLICIPIVEMVVLGSLVAGCICFLLVHPVSWNAIILGALAICSTVIWVRGRKSVASVMESAWIYKNRNPTLFRWFDAETSFALLLSVVRAAVALPGALMIANIFSRTIYIDAELNSVPLAVCIYSVLWSTFAWSACVDGGIVRWFLWPLIPVWPILCLVVRPRAVLLGLAVIAIVVVLVPVMIKFMDAYVQPMMRGLLVFYALIMIPVVLLMVGSVAALLLDVGSIVRASRIAPATLGGEFFLAELGKYRTNWGRRIFMNMVRRRGLVQASPVSAGIVRELVKALELARKRRESHIGKLTGVRGLAWEIRRLPEILRCMVFGPSMSPLRLGQPERDGFNQFVSRWLDGLRYDIERGPRQDWDASVLDEACRLYVTLVAEGRAPRAEALSQSYVQPGAEEI